MVSTLLTLLRRRGIIRFHQNNATLVKNMEKLFKSFATYIISALLVQLINGSQNAKMNNMQVCLEITVAKGLKGMSM